MDRLPEHRGKTQCPPLHVQQAREEFFIQEPVDVLYGCRAGPSNEFKEERMAPGLLVDLLEGRFRYVLQAKHLGSATLVKAVEM